MARLDEGRGKDWERDRVMFLKHLTVEIAASILNSLHVLQSRFCFFGT